MSRIIRGWSGSKRSTPTSKAHEAVFNIDEAPAQRVYRIKDRGAVIVEFSIG